MGIITRSKSTALVATAISPSASSPVQRGNTKNRSRAKLRSNTVCSISTSPVGVHQIQTRTTTLK